MGESDIRGRMQMLKELLRSTINHLHTVFETQVFIAICRWYWDRMAQDVLGFLESRKENRSWYKGSQIAVSVSKVRHCRMFLASWKTGKKIDQGTKVPKLLYPFWMILSHHRCNSSSAMHSQQKTLSHQGLSWKGCLLLDHYLCRLQ